MYTNIDNEWATLMTPRLHLRRFRPADTLPFFTYRSDPAVCAFQLWHPRSLEESHAFIALQSELNPDTPDTWYQLAICETSTGRLVGDCGLHFLESGSAQVEIGFTINPADQGKGYASETVRGLLDYLLIFLHKHRVCASVDPRNIPSVRVLEAVGMRKEAYFRQSVRTADGWADDAVYAILAAEWPGSGWQPRLITKEETAVLFSFMKPGEETEVAQLVREVFMEFEAPDYPREGVEEFLRFTDPAILRNRCDTDDFFVICCRSQSALLGVIAVRDSSHISLLFVRKEYHRQGIARALFQRARERCLHISPELAHLTVNSSPYAVTVYERLGFLPDGPEQMRDGILFTPMSCRVVTPRNAAQSD